MTKLDGYKMSNNGHNMAGNSDGELSDSTIELLFRYFEGIVNKTEIDRVNALLDDSHEAREVLQSLIRYSVESRRETGQQPKLTPEMQTEMIMQYLKEDRLTGKPPQGRQGAGAFLSYHYGQARKNMFTGLAYALILLAIVLVGSWGSVRGYQYASDWFFLTEFTYDNAVPYQGSLSSFRGAGESYPEDLEVKSFAYQLELALGRYFGRNYREAIGILQKIEPGIRLLAQNDAVDTPVRALIQDYYFYLGLSYFALSRSESGSGQDKTEHGQEAIKYLDHAYNAFEDADTAKINAIDYHRALAYGFNNQQARANEILQRLVSDPKWGKSARRLRTIWSD